MCFLNIIVIRLFIQYISLVFLCIILSPIFFLFSYHLFISIPYNLLSKFRLLSKLCEVYFSKFLYSYTFIKIIVFFTFYDWFLYTFQLWYVRTKLCFILRNRAFVIYSSSRIHSYWMSLFYLLSGLNILSYDIFNI